MLDKLDAALRFGQEALNLRAQRQEILAANIANADTPGYQARDIDFASQLNKVMEQGRVNGSGVALNLTSARHIPAQNMQPPSLDLMFRVPDQPSLDGNTVDMRALVGAVQIAQDDGAMQDLSIEADDELTSFKL